MVCKKFLQIELFVKKCWYIAPEKIMKLMLEFVSSPLFFSFWVKATLRNKTTS